MAVVTAWAAIVGSIVAGSLIAERTRRRVRQEPFGARRRWLLAAVIPLAVYPLGGHDLYGFGIFGLLCVLPPFAFLRHRWFRTIAYASAGLTGLVGLASLLPFIELGGPLLVVAACICAAARDRQGADATVPDAAPKRPRAMAPRLRFMIVANGLVLALSTVVAFGAGRPG